MADDDSWLTIGAVASRAGVAPSALRLYEAERLIRSIRTGGGQRRFHRDTLRRIAFIRVAQRVGLTLEEIHAALATLPDARTPTPADWGRLSRSWKPRLDAQIATLERLRDRLTSCIGCGCLSLQACALYNPADAASELGAGPRYLLGNSPDDLPKRVTPARARAARPGSAPPRSPSPSRSGRGGRGRRATLPG
jgi:MerR family redox-sensitive transcriptional activator SoxR